MIGNIFKRCCRIFFLYIPPIVIVLLMSRATEAFKPVQSDPPATLTVTKLSDTNDGVCDADCSLREALKASSPNSIIDFAPKLDGKIKLKSTLRINKNLTINGPTTKSITISGNKDVRVFWVEANTHFTIRNLTISDGYVEGAHGTDNEECVIGNYGQPARGGGLHNKGGTVVIINCNFTSNKVQGGKGGRGGNCERAGAKGGFGGDGEGGALFSTGTVLLINSTFSDNIAIGGQGGSGGIGTALNRRGGGGGVGGNAIGGGLFSTGTAFLVNSTFSGNRVIGGESGRGGLSGSMDSGGPGFSGNSYGGAIYNSNSMQISSCTLANNMGSTRGRGNYASDVIGGAIYNRGQLKVKNTIVANSPSGGNCGGLDWRIISEGYNIDSDGTCHLKGPGDFNKVDPKLKSLKRNDGTTLTHALKSDSPAIDAGNPAGCTDHEDKLISTDQRGYSRPWGSRCDIGAFELSRQ